MNGKLVRRILFYIVVVIVTMYFLYPLYILFLMAFTPVQYTLGALRPPLIPPALTLSYLYTAFQSTDLIDPLIISLETAFIVGAIALAIGIPAAYGLTRLSRRLSNGVSTLLYVTNMMPALAIAIPISVEFIDVGKYIPGGLFDTPLGLALTQELVVLPLTIFILVGAFESLPKDLEAQARVDGASMLRTLYLLLVPLAKAGVAAAFLLAWIMSWDEFTYAALLVPINPTLPLVIYLNITRGNILASSAFALIVTVPVLILALFLQRFLRGELLTAGLTG
ncbi:MAG: carbohydrate ABC transporter permease [archaeon]|nr:carbohydrate ABC transporter permease [archaeon]